MSLLHTNISDSKINCSEQWWVDLINGDKSGLEAIYDYYVDDLYRYGMAINNNNSLIKDCIQEVFISLWKYRNNLKKGVNVKSYLYRCLSNKIQKEIVKDRKKFHSNSIENFEYLFLVDSCEKKMIDKQLLSELQQKLSTGITSLPDRQKEVIHLLFFENKTYEEVSNIMSINLRSVYTLAWKAISKLKKLIAAISLLLFACNF
ncbi:RNA polymerase sigma factor [Echinicola sp. 20G]|uniref:RNA polymerase sigma factor n=1 Tax=Echinicola sp. 20G TaxID=2781961 RepID=UPI00191099B1|nr:sigma-70 family RNA polymerase sigma factor [Echinicola sp. 20G]